MAAGPKPGAGVGLPSGPRCVSGPSGVLPDDVGADGPTPAVRTRGRAALTVTGVLLAMLGAAGFIIVHGILARLRQLKSVSDRLARAGKSGRSH